MNDFDEFTKNMTKLESEAWDWIIRLDADDNMTEREKSQLTQWLARSPAHVEQIRKLNEFWGNQALADLLQPAKKSVARSSKNVQNIPAKSASKNKTTWLNPAYGFAFAMMLAVVGSVFYWQQPTQIDDYANTYVTAFGQHKQIKLTDGSTVTLNSNSQLKVAYSQGSRDIWLVKGEAHFAVSKDKQRPFNVYAANGRVQAVGTAFTVDLASQSNLNVLVTEGKIALALARPENNQLNLDQVFSTDDLTVHSSYSGLMQDIAFMSAGDFVGFDSAMDIETAKHDLTHSIKTLSAQDIEARQAWQQGELVFTGQSLKEVVSQLKRYSPLQIEIADPSLENLKIGGRFDINHIEGLLKNLEANFNIKVQKTALDKVVINKADS
ncbi:FecR domain-containing protein [Catenovulum sp. 2E275]|uniref:FecR family protein n=1 Tax=Catenovulum sp. 2E275 TaxID=2980497 RepID=UPI0021CE3A10|nr:FecR domain-containing protein [Catenovulum sp. 2E275]MCU4677298.1 FecR domain-containing protein [Catenovulum sp. 2E275]